jgi:hypothetical protein
MDYLNVKIQIVEKNMMEVMVLEDFVVKNVETII